jgi:hypothetical protein
MGLPQILVLAILTTHLIGQLICRDQGIISDAKLGFHFFASFATALILYWVGFFPDI